MVVISIQELTRETGVTVRTLRYYDQIDLLK
ncbi:MerR family DNA-binding transcriptional regulator, partial [Bacillus thuringiensis]